MVLMGGGHLSAVVSSAFAHNQTLDYRLVSLITTGVMLAFPGLLSVVLCIAAAALGVMLARQI